MSIIANIVLLFDDFLNLKNARFLQRAFFANIQCLVLTDSDIVVSFAFLTTNIYNLIEVLILVPLINGEKENAK